MKTKQIAKDTATIKTNQPKMEANAPRTATPQLVTEPSAKVLPIVYHPGVSEVFDLWALGCDLATEDLHRKTTDAIRFHHSESIPKGHCMTARPTARDIFQLSLGAANVYYSVEAVQIVVRGYGWELESEQLDDFDGGGYFVDPVK